MNRAAPRCVGAALLAVAVLGAGGARAERLPALEDFYRCFSLTTSPGTVPTGRFRMQLLIRKDGHVYGSFLSSDNTGLVRSMQRCIASQGLIWTFPPADVDYRVTYPVSLASPGFLGWQPGSSGDLRNPSTSPWGPGNTPAVLLPALSDPPAPAPIDPGLAVATLDLRGDATPAEKGEAYLAAHEYAEAVPLLREAVANNAVDVQAHRALAQALAETHEDLVEARRHADWLKQNAPGSEAFHEANLRVCVAEQNDLCTFQEFKATLAAADIGPRSRQIRDELLGPTQEAAARLRQMAAARKARGEDSAARQNPCPVETSGKNSPCARPVAHAHPPVVQVTIRTIAARNGTDSSLHLDPKLEPISASIRDFGQNFRFQSYQLLEERTFALDWKNPTQLDLPGSRSLELSPRQVGADGRIRVHLELLGPRPRREQALHTDYTIARGGTILFGGLSVEPGSAQAGTLLIAVTQTEK